MKKVLLALLLALGVSAMAQQNIQFRSANRAECVKSDFTSLKASFSFSGLEANNVNTERGVFSTLTMPNTVIGGNEGDPQIPAVSELIAVPFGASPTIRVTSYSTTDYVLEDYGIHTLMPRQPDLRKDQRPEDVPFVYNEAAYQSTRGLRSEPMVRVSVDGTMRGVQIGRMSIEPVSYDPVNNKIRVFNDIEVEVSFNGANRSATEEMLVKTYSPYFNGIYEQLFNGRAVRDVYEDHPDLWKAPVRMLVITNRMFEDCIQDWVAWKTMKGIYVDVNYTDNIGTTASAIQSFIQNKYAQNTPTFLMIMGDKDQVPASANGSETGCVTDLSYSSVDGDEFADMFHSRFPAENVAQMTAMLNKALEYEQYTMPDPSYLNNVLLIAGEDSGWGVTVGRPTIWYATNYYYNAEHGFQNVYEYSHGTYTDCYNNLNTGVGFVNYTAHGSNTSWAGPSFTVSDVNNLTNEHKYFLAMGNCCQAADWGISGTCFGEAMVRAENKGAYAYIGSCPSTYWLNDYYFGVGPTSRADGTMPTMEETGTGCYDAIWNDDAYNTVNSILYIGNLAGNAAGALGYELHISTLYCWQAYHVLGDGSIMPYRVQPTANQVSHMAILPIGVSTYEVSAVPGSYVAISKDGVLHGAALVGDSGTVPVPITPVTSGGDVTICVTAPNRIPYIQTVPAAALEGAYITVDGYTPTEAHVGDNTNLSITFKNVGTDASIGTTNVTLSTEDSNVTLGNHTGSFGALAAEATTTVSGFSFSINPGVADGTNVTLHYTAVNGSDTYEGNIIVKANEAVLEYSGMTWNGGFTPGETLTVSAKFKNTGHWPATNAAIELTTTSNYVTINTQSVTAGTIEVGQEVTYDFSVTIAANCPETEQMPITFTMTADGGLTAQGTETLKNACNVVFNLVDSYGDGWNGNKLTASFSDGSPSQEMTISTGSSAEYILEIGNGTHVTLTWTTGSYASECSFSVSYEGDLIIYQSSGTPSAGVLYEFDCNCAAASQTFMVTVASENTEHGTVTGGGEFSYGQTCTVTATANEGYFFTGWTQNGEVVSTATTYTFNVTSDMDLVAHFAEGHMIGDGGEATDSYLPTYNYYNYSLTEQIYTSEELGEAGMITSIAFFNGGAEKTRTLVFYMKATDKTTFTGSNDWVTVSEADKVFSGSVTMTADAWTFITFDTPFLYDGSTNVVLVTDDNSGNYTNSPNMTCRVFDAASQALRIYSDNTNYDPYNPTSYSGTVQNVKNQLLFTKESMGDCVRPTNLTATEIGPDFVTFDWTENGASEEWYIFYGESLETAVVVDHHPYTLTGLTPETTYQANVYPACGIDDPSTTFASNLITFTTLEACPAIENVEVGNITGNAVTVTWAGYSESYLVQLGIPSFLVSATFANSIPSDWTNDATYPWTIVDGHIQSGNAGVASSTSGISVTVNYPADGTVEFDAECMGEGTSTYWDHCDFAIDNETMLNAGANLNTEGWLHYSFDVTAGEHTFTWSYTKDGSVNPTGDYFAVDNVVMKSGETVWNDPVEVEGAEHTFGGLTPLTTYCVRVKGVCGEDETDWSDIVTFTTTEQTIATETVTLAAGTNYFSSNVEITLEDLQNALTNVLGTNASITISSQTQSCTLKRNRWTGTLETIDLSQMYMIEIENACEISLEGEPINPTDHPVTISFGENWVAFPLNVAMSLDEAFDGFAQNDDAVSSQTQNASRKRNKWTGTLTELQPGQGFIYTSSVNGNRTLVFPTSK